MNIKKVRIFSVVLFILLCISYTIKNFDLNNDVFYLIKLGENILRNGVDMKDHFCFVETLNYTYPHWLYSVYIFLIYHQFGYFGIYVSNIIIYIIFILVIYYVNLKMTKNDFLSFLVSMLTIPIICPFMLARSQQISIILLFLEVYFINKLIESGLKKYIVYLALISLFIANIHATIWLMILILFLPFIVEYIILFIVSKKKGKEKSIKIFNNILLDFCPNFKLIVVAFLICFVMGLLSPSKICYTYLFKTLLGDSQQYIGEHAALEPITAPFFLFGIFLLYIIRPHMKLRELFMMLGLSILSLLSIRYLLFFYTIYFLYLAILIDRDLKEKNDKTLDILQQKLFGNNLICIICILSVTFFCIYKLVSNQNQEYINKKLYPVDATMYIKNNLDYNNIRLYNDYDYGSYLLFNDIPVFIDSRCDLYFKEFNKKNLDIFDEAINIHKNYDEVISKYNIKYVLLNKDDVLYLILNKDNSYIKIYEDKYYVIFEKISSY